MWLEKQLTKLWLGYGATRERTWKALIDKEKERFAKSWFNRLFRRKPLTDEQAKDRILWRAAAPWNYPVYPTHLLKYELTARSILALVEASYEEYVYVSASDLDYLIFDGVSDG